MSADVPASAVELTATSPRGVAHPSPVRILGLLREHGPATATLDEAAADGEAEGWL